MNENKFDQLVKNLRKNGYKVKVSIEDQYRFALIKGKWIIGGFCEPNNGDSYNSINNRISFDHVKKFTKWYDCPYSFPIPNTEEQFKYVLSKMKLLSSLDPYKKTHEYNFQSENEYPINIK